MNQGWNILDKHDLEIGEIGCGIIFMIVQSQCLRWSIFTKRVGRCAGVQAVCQSKGFELYDFLFASDMLEEVGEWKNHLLGTAEEYDMQIMCMKLALELARVL